MHKIDIEQIMTEIIKEIKEKGYQEENVKFQDISISRVLSEMDDIEFNFEELQCHVKQCSKDWNNPMSFPPTTNNFIKKFYQKIVRRLSKCVFWPIVNYQNKFNFEIVKALNQIQNYIKDSDSRQETRGTLNEAEITERIEEISRHLMYVKWLYIGDKANKEENSSDIVKCNICGHQAIRSSYETKVAECQFNGGRLERYVCPKCGVIFGPTKFSNLTQEEIDEDYKIHYYGFSEGDSLKKELEAFYMLEPNKDEVYLNYGCGCWSQSIQQLRKEGYNVYGYEPYAPESDNPYMITCEKELVKMKFDGIYSNDLLEHLLDPTDSLCFMKTLLMHADSKMAHCTACYVYKYENTRFHTHFYTGNSLEVLCAKAGLQILGHRDALEERDFICYLFGKEEDSTDFKPCLHVSEFGERRDGNIVLHTNGIIYGPYMVLGRGEYKLRLLVHLNGRKKILLKITADKGKKLIDSINLVEGKNLIEYKLNMIQENVEFVIENEGEKDIVIEEISML